MFTVRTYPEFSWSLSRHKTLMECPRKYAYHYYISHNGWLNEAPQIAKDAYRLKKMTNLEMLFGSIVHDIIHRVIEGYIANGFIPSEEELKNRIRTMLNTSFVDSTKRREQWQQRPNYFTMLHEIYYKGALPQEKVHDIQERLDVCIHHFFSSKTFTDIQNKHQMRFFEAEKFRRMELDETEIVVVMDFIYRDIREDK